MSAVIFLSVTESFLCSKSRFWRGFCTASAFIDPVVAIDLVVGVVY